MADEIDWCEFCKDPLQFNSHESEYVCTSCGFVARGHCFDQFFAESVQTIPIQSNGIGKMQRPGARRLASAQRKMEKRNSPYDRRYYSNEKINQIRNCCPEIKGQEMLSIASPILVRSTDPRAIKFFNCNPEDLTRDDITLLCRLASKFKVPASRSERWIQIKWRLCNNQAWDPDSPVIRPENREDWDPNWPWKPDLLPSHLVTPLNTAASALREAFDETLKRLQDVYPVVFHPLIARKSMINWSFMIQRILYMLCPGCCELAATVGEGEFVEHDDPSCWARRFSWALKPLATKDNVASHVCWWYFLILYLARVTQYDAPILPNFKWEISKADSLLDPKKLPEKYAELCNQIRVQLSPTSPNPDLVPFPLRQSAPKSLQQFHRVSKEAKDRPLKRQRR